MGLYIRGRRMWWCTYTVNGVQRHESLKTNNKRVAERLFRARLGDIAQNRFLPPARQSPYLSDFAKLFLETIGHANTKRTYKNSLDCISRFFPKARIAQIASRDVEIFKKQRLGDGVGPATVNRQLAVLRRLLNVAMRQQLIADTPFKYVEFLEERRHRRQPRILTYEEQEKILAVAPPRIRVFLVLGVETGLRTGEMHRLRWADLDFDKGVLHVRQSKTFAGTRSVPLSEFCKTELLQWRDLLGKDFSEWVFPNFANTRHRLQGGRKRWISTLEKAGVPMFCRYFLRHTFASRLGAAGVSPLTIAHLLGHSSIGIVMTYAKGLSEASRDAIQKLGRRAI